MKTIHLFKISRLIQAAALSASLIWASSAFAADYSSYLIDLNSGKVTDLGSLGGGNTQAKAINDMGQVVGESRTAGGISHAFITGPNGKGMTDLGTLGGGYSRATDINNAGQVVGYFNTQGYYFDTAETTHHAFITGPNGISMTDLGAIGVQNYSEAYGINGAGQVVGASSGYAFATGPNGVGMGTFGTINGGATGISDHSKVVGSQSEPDQSGFITDLNNSGVPILRRLHMPIVDTPVTDPAAVNDSGQVVGNFLTNQAIHGNGIIHAFLTGSNGMGATDLGTLGGYNSSASGISAAGQVVGWSDMPDGSRHAFITGPNGIGLIDLNSLLSLPVEATWNEATAINNMGQVVVSGIPEPASYALMLAGLGVVGFMTRRRKAGEQRLPASSDDLIH